MHHISNKQLVTLCCCFILVSALYAQHSNNDPGRSSEQPPNDLALVMARLQALIAKSTNINTVEARDNVRTPNIRALPPKKHASSTHIQRKARAQLPKEES